MAEGSPGAGDPRVLGREPLCRGRRLVLERVIAEIRGRRVALDALRHPGAVAILAVDDAGRVLLERQYRPVVGEWLYEVPAGTLEPGEDPLETAKRELLEETGYTASSWRRLLVFYTSPGVSTEVMHLYEARGLRYRGARPEEDELIETVFVPLSKAVEMIWSGEIRDAKTIIALFSAALRA